MLPTALGGIKIDRNTNPFYWPPNHLGDSSRWQMKATIFGQIHLQQALRFTTTDQ